MLQRGGCRWDDLDDMVNVRITKKACKLAPLVVNDDPMVDNDPIVDDTSAVNKLLRVAMVAVSGVAS